MKQYSNDLDFFLFVFLLRMIITYSFFFSQRHFRRLSFSKGLAKQLSPIQIVQSCGWREIHILLDQSNLLRLNRLIKLDYWFLAKYTAQDISALPNFCFLFIFYLNYTIRSAWAMEYVDGTSGLRPLPYESTGWSWAITCNAWGGDPGGCAFRDLAAEEIMWPVTLHFGSSRARRSVREVYSDKLAAQVRAPNFFFAKQTFNPFYFKGVWRQWIKKYFLEHFYCKVYSTEFL